MGRTVVEGIAIVALAVATLAFIARYVPSFNRPLLATAALAPYLMLGAPLSVILFAWLRNWPMVTVAGVITVTTAVVQLPWHVGTKSDAGPTVRVVSANLRYGRADAAALVQLGAKHADILAVQELTPEKADLLSAAGIDKTFPYHLLRAREGAAGVGIWSRYPIGYGRDYDEFWLGLITVPVQIPDFEGELTVIAAHRSAPWPDPLEGWRDDLARLNTTLQDIAALARGPVILAGDLNATR
jgi:endonuclease/exonuclease/phosphatase (EEP) superfamily protein YafD